MSVAVNKREAWLGLLVPIVVAVSTVAVAAEAPLIDPGLFKSMKWRLIGPFRGGRVLAVTGVWASRRSTTSGR